MKHLRSQYWSMVAPLNLTLVLLLLLMRAIWQMIRLSSRGSARALQISVGAASGTVLFLPMLNVLLLSSALLVQLLVPSNVSLLFVFLLLLTCGYVIVRYCVVQFRRAVSRGVTIIFVIARSDALYITSYALLLPQHVCEAVQLAMQLEWARPLPDQHGALPTTILAPAGVGAAPTRHSRATQKGCCA